MGVIMARIDVKAPPSKASKLVLAPENLSKWCEGVLSYKADSNWPTKGAALEWQTEKGPYAARVMENHLPAEIKIEIKAPTQDWVVSHIFEATSDNQTRYEKIIEPTYHGFGKFFPPFANSMLRSQVRQEVERAAAFVHGVGTSPR